MVISLRRQPPYLQRIAKTKKIFSTVILLIAAIITITGWASSPPATDTSGERTCFNIREITTWSAIDDKHLYVEGIRSDNKYLFTMFSSCHGIRFSRAIALSNQMSRVCSNDFGKVTYKDGGRRMSCDINNIEQVANKKDAVGIVEAKGE